MESLAGSKQHLQACTGEVTAGRATFTVLRSTSAHIDTVAYPGRTTNENRDATTRGKLAMNSYTITIAPNDDSGNSTTLIVDTSEDQVRITDVQLHATNGLTGGQMPTVDFALLLRAVASSSGSPTAIETVPATVPAPADVQAPTPDPSVAAQARTAPSASKPRRTKRTATATTPQPAAPPAARRDTAATAAAGKATKAAGKRSGRGSSPARTPKPTKAVAETATNGRAYRRMPQDFAAVYGQGSTAAAIADHYGVPHHTAQGWIRRVKTTKAVAS